MTSPAPKHETSQHGFFREKQLRFYRQHGNQTLRYTVSSSSKGTIEGILSHSGLACCVACPSKLGSEFFRNNSWPNHYQSNQFGKSVVVKAVKRSVDPFFGLLKLTWPAWHCGKKNTLTLDYTLLDDSRWIYPLVMDFT